MQKEQQYILAIETSSNYLGIGLFNHKHKLSIVNHYLPNSHDTLLAETIKYILNLNKIQVKDLKYVTLSSGPGSFTGLRIGASLAKALCFEEEVESNNELSSTKLIAVSSLELLFIDFLDKNLEQIINSKVIVDNLDEINFNVYIYIKSHKNIYYKQLVEVNLKNQKFTKLSEMFAQINTKFNEIELIEIGEEYLNSVENNDNNEKNQNKNEFRITNSVDLIEYLKNREKLYFAELNIENIILPTLKKIEIGEFEDASTFVPFYAQEFQLNTNQKSTHKNNIK